jgi:hypothetical protein
MFGSSGGVVVVGWWWVLAVLKGDGDFRVKGVGVFRGFSVFSGCGEIRCEVILEARFRAQGRLDDQRRVSGGGGAPRARAAAAAKEDQRVERVRKQTHGA